MIIKKAFLLFLITIMFKLGYAQFMVGVQTNFGVNIVDIEKATGSPKYENREYPTSTYLDDWNTFGFHGAIRGIFETDKALSFGAELSFNRLYFWQEAYFTGASSSPYFRWGTIWTTGIGGLAHYKITDIIYIQPGLSVHIFPDGTTVGTSAAIGVDIPVNESFKIPVEFRTDQIFGDATSILINLGVGLKIVL